MKRTSQTATTRHGTYAYAKYTHLSIKGQLNISVRLMRQFGWQPGTTRLLISVAESGRSLSIRPVTPREEAER